MRRIILLTIRNIVIVALLLLMSVFFVFYTSLGSRIAIELITKMAPGKLLITQMEGKLGSNIRLRRVTYVNDNLQISVDSLYLSWQPWQLLKRKIVVNDFSSNGIRINLTKTHGTKNSDLPYLPSLLKNLFIYNLNIKNISLFQNQLALLLVNELTLIRNKNSSYSIKFNSDLGEAKGVFNINFTPYLTWNIFLQSNNLDLSWISPNNKSNLNFLLYNKGIWSTDNKKFDLHINELYGHLNQLPLHGLASLHFNNGKFEIANSEIFIADSIIKFSGNIQNDWDIQWQLNIPHLDKILSNANGRIFSAGKIIGPQKSPHIQANLKANHIILADIKIDNVTGTIFSSLKSMCKVNLLANNIGIYNYVIPNLNFNMDSQLINEKLKSKLMILLSPANQINGEITLSKFTSFTDFDQPVESTISVRFTRLAELLKIPETKDLQGSLSGKIDIDGTLAKPLFSIAAALDNGHVIIPKLGIALNAIFMQAKHEANLIHFIGNFNSGSGKGKIHGTMAINNHSFPLRLKLEGNNLQVLKLPEYTINASPNLILNYDHEIDIQGKLIIDHAHILLKNMGSNTTLPPEVIFVDQPKPESPSLATNLSMHVELGLGDDVHLNYENLKAKLGGKLIITQHAGSTATATGELHTVQGEYRAYGKLLTIKEGRLIYTGNILTNPGLNIRAVKNIKIVPMAKHTNLFNNDDPLESAYSGSGSLSVGVWVKGTLNNPQVSLFSDPSGISQADILSYLVLGYPQSKITKASSLALLNSAASKLNFDDQNVMGGIERTKKMLGLSELSVDSTGIFDPSAKDFSSNITAFNVGKQLGRRLYLHYSMGLFKPVQVLNLKYQITKRWAVQSETSSFDTGGDLIYEVEKD